MKNLIVPKNFDAKSLIKSYNSEHELKLKEFPLNYIMHTALELTCKSYLQKDDFDIERGYFRMSTEMLDKVLNGYYKPALDCLIDKGIISVRQNYLKGQHCRLYSLNNEFCFEPRVLPLSKKEQQHTRGNLYSLPDYKKVNWLDNARDFLFETLESKHLLFNESVFQKIEEIREREKADLKDEKEIEKLDFELQLQVNLIKAFNLGYRDGAHSDSFGFRFHSNVTMIRSELRKFLEFKGKKLVEIDIKNCQPFLLLSLFDEEFWESCHNREAYPFTLAYFDPSLHRHMKRNYSELVSSIIFPKNHKNRAEIASQKRRFTYRVVKGVIYEKFMNELGIKTNTQAEFNNLRKKVKQDVIMTINAKPSDRSRGGYFSGNVRRIFRKEYPIVLELLDALKSSETGILVRYGNRRSKNFINNSRRTKSQIHESEVVAPLVDSGYKKLASLLQKMESNLIIDRVARMLNDENPNIPVVTVHDCIMTTSENVEDAKELIEHVFGKLIGYVPQLEIK